VEKFNRKYILSVGASSLGQKIVFDYNTAPFTIEFDIQRNILSSANNASIRIKNLSEVTRDKIRKNRWDYGVFRGVNLRAGYDDNLPTIFDGNITQCWSVREGSDFISQIEAFDGGYAFQNSITSMSFPEGTSQDSIIRSLLSNLQPSVTVGAIGDLPNTKSTRATVYSGPTMDILREITGERCFVDNSKINVLADTECLEGSIQVISSQSGLLGTPILEETYLNFDMIFEPRLQIGQRVRLESLTGAIFNGFYKVISLKHKGIISPTVSGNAVTSVGLFAPQALQVVA